MFGEVRDAEAMKHGDFPRTLSQQNLVLVDQGTAELFVSKIAESTADTSVTEWRGPKVATLTITLQVIVTWI